MTDYKSVAAYYQPGGWIDFAVSSDSLSGMEINDLALDMGLKVDDNGYWIIRRGENIDMGIESCLTHDVRRAK